MDIIITTNKKVEINKNSLIKYLAFLGVLGIILLILITFAIIGSIGSFDSVIKEHTPSPLFLYLIELLILSSLIARIAIDIYWLLKKPHIMVGSTTTRFVLMPFLKSHKVDFARLSNTNLVFYIRDDKLVVAEIHAECPICKTVNQNHELKPAISYKRTITLREDAQVRLEIVRNAFVLECEEEPLHTFKVNVENLESGKLKSSPTALWTLHRTEANV